MFGRFFSLAFFKFLLQLLVHLMKFKRRTHILEVGDRKKSSNYLVGKKRTEALLVFEKSNTEKNCVLTEWVLTRYSFYKKPKLVSHSQGSSLCIRGEACFAFAGKLVSHSERHLLRICRGNLF